MALERQDAPPICCGNHRTELSLKKSLAGNPTGLVAWNKETPSCLPKSCPVTAIVLTKDESVNIERCLSSLGWCDQVVCIDSGSSDDTVALAKASGADVIETTWRGFGAQREFALRHESVRHDWIYFVDADEWVSQELATEILSVIGESRHSVYMLRFRFVFLGKWMKHAGWYKNSWIPRLAQKSQVSFLMAGFAERMTPVEGSIGRLVNDLVDEDLKGLGAWVEKHGRYVRLAATERTARGAVTGRPPTMPRSRYLLKYRVFPRIPFKPAALWVYMYILRAGFLSGAEGLTFCTMHATFEYQIGALMRAERARADVSLTHL